MQFEIITLLYSTYPIKNLFNRQRRLQSHPQNKVKDQKIMQIYNYCSMFNQCRCIRINHLRGNDYSIPPSTHLVMYDLYQLIIISVLFLFYLQ